MKLVSIVIPVKNDALLLEKCLESIKNLRYPHIETIIADGNSTDNTVEIAKKYGAIVVNNKKETVSPGRNVGFEASKGDLIAFTDADVVATKDWICNCIKYFKDPKVGGVGGPNYTPKEDSKFGKAVSHVLRYGCQISDSVQSVEDSIKSTKPVVSLPGCNAIYRRDALQKVMPVREDLLTCDDTELNRRIIDQGYVLLFTPDTIVYHYRRDNPKKFFKQIYRYAIGRVQAGRNDKRMIKTIHHLTAFVVPGSLICYAIIITISPYALLLLILFGILISFNQIIYAYSIFIVAWTLGYWREQLFPLKEVQGK